MNRRGFLGVSTVALAVGGASAREEKPRRGRRGVSLAGPEFGTDKADFSNENPGVFGRDFTYHSERTVAYFCENKVPLLRLPLRWERLQPRLGQPLDADELKRLRTFLGWAKKHGGQVLLDVHNYGRYVIRRGGKRVECIIDQVLGKEVVVSRDHFADLWRRLSQEFADDSVVVGYGLMNEPHDMGGSDWKKIAQAAVDAVRARKDKKLILVTGDDWSSAHRFVRANGPTPWIKDGVGELAYEAHCYFDEDHSGRYRRSHEAEQKRDARLTDRAADRLMPFVGWCLLNRVRGFVGEFGIPGDEKGWQPMLGQLLEVIDRAGMEGCYWAAGEWWGRYRLSMQPTQEFKRAAPQLALLTR